VPVTEEARMRAVNMVLRRKLQDCRAASMKACADLCDDHGFTEAAKMLREAAGGHLPDQGGRGGRAEDHQDH
jgi:hypothetical protein